MEKSPFLMAVQRVVPIEHDALGLARLGLDGARSADGRPHSCRERSSCTASRRRWPGFAREPLAGTGFAAVAAAAAAFAFEVLLAAEQSQQRVAQLIVEVLISQR